MLRSLVGSEMCIRDRSGSPSNPGSPAQLNPAQWNSAQLSLVHPGKLSFAQPSPASSGEPAQPSQPSLASPARPAQPSPAQSHRLRRVAIGRVFCWDFSAGSLETTILPHLYHVDHPVGDLLHPPHFRMLLILLALFKRLVPSCEAFWQAILNGS